LAQLQISVYVAVSLDGFIARENGSLDWLGMVQGTGSEDYGYRAFMDTIDTVVMGRNTYDTVLGFGDWPFKGKRVVVLTSRPLTPKNGETNHSGDLQPLLQKLENLSVRRIYLDGGASIRQGLTEGIVDDLILSWIPILLGKGRPLFGGDIPENGWQLSDAKSFSSGIVQATYRRSHE
jgi:dihydrofolate reductase